MKPINRREFGKLAAVAALGAPLVFDPLPAIAAAQETKRPRPMPVPPKERLPEMEAASKLRLTPAQQKELQKELEDRKKFLAGLRAKTLPYNLEPAFVFRADFEPARRRKAV